MSNKSKLLLINFSKEEAAAVSKATGTDVYRGYLSDGGIVGIDYTGNEKPAFSYYFPVPPYECSMVFINLDNYEKSRAEFQDRELPWTAREGVTLLDYWKRGDNLVVYFVGNTKVQEMHTLAVPAKLIKSSGVDTESTVTLREERTHRQLFNELKKKIVMPNSHYIEAESSSDLYALGTEAYSAIKNMNDDDLSVIFGKDRYDYDEGIGLILLPTPKNLASTTAAIYKDFKGGNENQEWIDSDYFYPAKKLDFLHGEIEEIIKQATEEITIRKAAVEEHRKEFSYLKDLVSAQGDVLVDAVYKVLTDVLKLKVKKSDEDNPGNHKEDLLITYKGQKILLEVKGTIRQYPSLTYTQKPLQHALRQGLKDVGVGLILNHDINVHPDKRKLAYNDKDTRSLITNIHFIDTRLILKIAKNVLDGHLTIDEAIEALFSKQGRAVYPDNKKSQK